MKLALLLGFGLAGMAGGLVIALLLRFRKIVPEGLENVFVVLALYQVSNFVISERWRQDQRSRDLGPHPSVLVHANFRERLAERLYRLGLLIALRVDIWEGCPPGRECRSHHPELEESATLPTGANAASIKV